MTFYSEDLARTHDEYFGDVAREASSKLLDDLAASGITEGLVVELGCGTGIMTAIVSDAGFDVLGVDISEGMLTHARRNAPRARFEHASLIDAEIPACVAVTAVGEPLNYAADPRAGLESVESVARRAHDALSPGGVFLFDVSTPGRQGPTGRTERFFIGDDRDWFIGQHATEVDDRRRLIRDLTLFVRQPDGSYRADPEHHELALYEKEEVGALLTHAGFEWEVAGSYSPEPGRSTPPWGWAVFTARPAVASGVVV